MFVKKFSFFHFRNKHKYAREWNGCCLATLATASVVCCPCHVCSETMAICLGREFCSRFGRLTQILVTLPSQLCLCNSYRTNNVSLYCFKQTRVHFGSHYARFDRFTLPRLRPSSNTLLSVSRLRNQTHFTPHSTCLFSTSAVCTMKFFIVWSLNKIKFSFLRCHRLATSWNSTKMTRWA